MHKECVVLPDRFSSVGPYSQVVKAGDLFFISGQIPIDLDTKKVLRSDIKVQTTQVMENIKKILAYLQLSMADIVKATIFTTDLNNFNAINEIYATYFAGDFPARSFIQVSKLPLDVDVEIEVIAVKD